MFQMIEIVPIIIHFNVMFIKSWLLLKRVTFAIKVWVSAITLDDW